MTISALGSVLTWPEPLDLTAATAISMNASAYKFAGVYQSPVTGNLDRVYLRFSSGGNAGNVHRVRIETLDSSGLPSGTLVTADAEATVTGAVTGAYELTLGTAAALTKGQFFAVVVSYDTFVATTSFAAFSRSLFVAGGGPYYELATAGTFSAKTAAKNPNIGLRFDGVYEYVPQATPAAILYTTPSASSSNTNEYATKFTLPWGARIVGCWATGISAAGAMFTLYDSSSTSLASLTVGAESVTAANDVGFYKFTASYDAASGFVGRIAIKGTTSTAVTPKGLDAPTSGAAAAFSAGAATQYSERVGAGAWTDTPTRRLQCGLLISGIDIPTNNRKVKVGGAFVAA